MLLNRAKELRSRIDQFQKVKTAARDAQPFDTRARQFSDVGRRIHELRDAIAGMDDADIAVNFHLANGTSLAEKASQLRTQLAEDPTVIHDPPFDLKHEFVDRLLAIAEAGKATAAERWGSYIRERANLGSEETLKVLAALPQLKECVARIRKNRSELILLSETLPNDPKAVLAQVKGLVDEAQAEWSKLEANDIPQEVIAFIRQSASEGAPLATLKPSIVSWLNERGLTDSFRVRLR